MKQIGCVVLSLVLLCGLFGADRLEAQCGFERGEIPWLIPPAFAGQDGDPQTLDPAKMYVGLRNGQIQRYTLDAISGIQQNGVLSPGDQIPAEVTAIMSLSIPSPDMLVALVIYENQGLHYGILRSEDGGDNWNLVKPAELTAIEVTEDDASRFMGNYWRAPLLQLEWLPDGQHGWLWGRSAALKTTDAGLTWTTIRTATNDPNRLVDHIEHQAIWGLDFKDASNGVVLVGSKLFWKIWYTTDGGDNWSLGGSPTSIQVIDITWTGNSYRILRADPFNFDGNNLQIVEDATGVGNSFSALSTRTGIPTLGGLMTEVLWPAHNIGFMVHRQGEFWKTEDRGKTWTQVQANEPDYPPVPFGDGVDIRPRAGYGQRSIFIRNEEGREFILQVLTDTCSGDLRDPLIYQFDIEPFASVPDDIERATTTIELRATPNLVTEDVELRFMLNSPAQTVASIVDTRGVTLKRIDFGLLESGDQVKTLNVNNIPSGLYQIVLRSGVEHGIEAVLVTK